MNDAFSVKVNLLKALAITIVVSGHLEFSLLGMFTPYSFQIALFFFISGYLFKEKYIDEVSNYIKRRVKTLLVPYFGYNVFYLFVTIFIARVSGTFWGKTVSLKNFFITPFINSHQFDLIGPLWFVTQLFITLIAFLFLLKTLRSIKDNNLFHLAVFTIIGMSAVPISKLIVMDSIGLILVRTLFSIFFVYIGFYYRHFIEDKIDIFTPKWFGSIIIFQSILWLFNRDFTPQQGIGLSYVLVWARFDNQLIVPILTALTGIWAALFVIKIGFNYLKDIKFINLIGRNTYHIMANHLLIMFIITAIMMKINGIPFEQRAQHDIYWIYEPLQTTYLYFIITITVTTFIGEGLKQIKKFLLNFFAIHKK